MAITIKTIDELVVGTIADASPVMFGQGNNIFRTTWGELKSEITGSFVNDLSYQLLTDNRIVDINSGNSFLNNRNATIPKGQLTFLQFKVIYENGSLGLNTYLIPLGEGNYSPLGGSISFSDLFLIDRVETVVESGDANTTTYSVTDLATINNADPSYDFSNTEFVYFVNLDGVLYEFIGTKGFYGLNDLQIDMNDLRLVTGAETITIDDNFNPNSNNPLTNQAITKGIGYDLFEYNETNDFVNFTLSGDFGIINDTVSGNTYFLVKNDVEINLNNSKVKILKNNESFDLYEPTIEQSNYKAYLLSGVDLTGFDLTNSFFFTWWRRKETVTELTYNPNLKKITYINEEENTSEVDLFNFVENIQQEITVGGIYNDFELEGNVLIFTNTNAQAILKGFNYDGKYKILYLINISGFPLRLDSLDAGSMAENQIKAPNQDVSIDLQGTSKLIYVDSIQKWMILDTYGSRYMPEHSGLTEDAAVTAGVNSVSKTRQIVNPRVIRLDINTIQTELSLNTLYPDATALQVDCPKIGKRYTKYDQLDNKWYEEDLTVL